MSGIKLNVLSRIANPCMIFRSISRRQRCDGDQGRLNSTGQRGDAVTRSFQRSELGCATLMCVDRGRFGLDLVALGYLASVEAMNQGRDYWRPLVSRQRQCDVAAPSRMQWRRLYGGGRVGAIATNTLFGVPAGSSSAASRGNNATRWYRPIPLSLCLYI